MDTDGHSAIPLAMNLDTLPRRERPYSVSIMKLKLLALPFALLALAVGCNKPAEPAKPATTSTTTAPAPAEKGTIGGTLLTLQNEFFH